MNAHEVVADRLWQMLNAELEGYRALSAALDEEAIALSRRDAQTLGELAVRKEGLTSTLQEYNEQRNALLEYAGFQADASAVTACIEHAPENRRKLLSALWGQLLDTATDCRERNHSHGRDIEINLDFNRRALGILRGEQPDNALYGANGRPGSGSGGSLILGSA